MSISSNIYLPNLTHLHLVQDYLLPQKTTFLMPILTKSVFFFFTENVFYACFLCSPKFESLGQTAMSQMLYITIETFMSDTTVVF